MGLNADAAVWAAWVGMNLRAPLLALAIGLGTIIRRPVKPGPGYTKQV